MQLISYRTLKEAQRAAKAAGKPSKQPSKPAAQPQALKAQSELQVKKPSAPAQPGEQNHFFNILTALFSMVC